MTMFALIDDTGNTGAKLLDEAQPAFMTASLVTRSDLDSQFSGDVQAIARSACAGELHASVLGVRRLEELAEDLFEGHKEGQTSWHSRHCQSKRTRLRFEAIELGSAMPRPKRPASPYRSFASSPEVTHLVVIMPAFR